jgi:hypothetical protein
MEKVCLSYFFASINVFLPSSSGAPRRPLRTCLNWSLSVRGRALVGARQRTSFKQVEFCTIGPQFDESRVVVPCLSSELDSWMKPPQVMGAERRRVRRRLLKIAVPNYPCEARGIEPLPRALDKQNFITAVVRGTCFVHGPHATPRSTGLIPHLLQEAFCYFFCESSQFLKNGPD